MQRRLSVLSCMQPLRAVRSASQARCSPRFAYHRAACVAAGAVSSNGRLQLSASAVASRSHRLSSASAASPGTHARYE
eukprot:5871919-Pleurochrysis_carterae.AAC.11